MHNYLKKIIADSQQAIDELTMNPQQRSSKKSFRKQLGCTGINVIAEIKRHSPAKGKLASIPNAAALAQEYATGGAAAVSVLTNPAFKGSLNDLRQVSQTLKHHTTAVLRKDFIIDTRQIFESIACGADALLLIVAVTKNHTKKLLQTCRDAGIDALVEVASRQELEYAIQIGADIIGINNRDLNTFQINPGHAVSLRNHIPQNCIAVAESGIDSVSSAKKYIDAGFHGLLIGEALVKSPEPQQLLRQIRDAARSY